MSVRRLLDRGDDEQPQPVSVPLTEWLEDLMMERDALIMRLRFLEKMLIRHGRLTNESLSRRER